MFARSKVVLVAALASALLAAPALASSLTATFSIDIYNYDAGGSRAQAFASESNLLDERFVTNLTWSGALDFRIDTRRDGVDDGTPSVQQFFDSGTGSIISTPLPDLSFDLSSGGGSGDNSWGTTTLFDIRATLPFAFGGDVVHDDGITLFDSGSIVAASPAPTSEKTTSFFFDGGEFRLIYAAANGDPSILEVDGPSEIPTPAAGLLLIAGLGGLAMVRQRRKQV